MLSSFVVTLLMLVPHARCQFTIETDPPDPIGTPIPDEDLSDQDKLNLVLNTLLHDLTSAMIAELVYQDEERAKYIEFNEGSLLDPYDWETGYYEYTQLPEPTEVPASKLKMLLERNGRIVKRPHKIDNHEVYAMEKVQTSKKKLPSIVERYLQTLQAGDCVDFPFGWADVLGNGCEWYAETDQCEKEALVEQLRNVQSATEACCGCGGGDNDEEDPTSTPTSDTASECVDEEGWTDSLGRACGDYNVEQCALASLFASEGEDSAMEACCICSTDPVDDCTDLEGYIDSIGLGCGAYTAIAQLCVIAGADENEFGISPMEACCVCQGEDMAVLCEAPNVANSNSLSACAFVEDGETCEFECDDDYELIGDQQITCTDGSWSPLPECHLRTCEPPVILNSNAISACAFVSEGGFCLFNCEEFFKLEPTAEGDYFPQCVGLEWTDLPTCESQARCPVPPIVDVNLDLLEALCTDLLVGEACFFSCNDGYAFGGDFFPTCKEGGVWDEDELLSARCVPLALCDDPAVVHSQSNVCADTSPGYQCQFECDDEYRLVGDFPLCLPDGTWDSIPFCEEIPTCHDFPIPDSDGGCESAVEGAYCDFECDNGFVRSGDSSPQCLLADEDGNLEWTFEEEPACDPEVICNPPFVSHATVNCPETKEGESCNSIQCDDLYELDGQYPTCLSTGYFDQIPTCRLITGCDAPDIPNSNVNQTCSFIFNGFPCSFSCDPGYEVTGPTELLCSGGEYGTLPSCEQDEPCLPPVIPNSNAACEDSEHGSVCSFQCLDDYKKVGPNLVCNDGVWEPDDYDDSCELIEYCPPLSVTDSNSGDVCADKEEGDSCVFSCNEGYERGGDYPVCITTDEDVLDWDSTSNPVCTEILTCPILGYDGSNDICEDYQLGQYCVFSCTDGYDRIGEYPQCLMVEGFLEWQTSNPNDPQGCEEIPTCSRPNIQHADQTKLAECDNANIGDFCQVECLDGFELSIDAVFPECEEESGEETRWADLPSCDEISYCPPDQTYANAEVSCTQVRENQACEFDCIEGYRLVGAFQVCVSINGTSTNLGYIGDAPTCEEILTCDLGPPIANSNADTCAGHDTGVACDIECDGDFTLVGFTPYCNRGTWETSSGDLPECLLVTPMAKFNTLDRQIFVDSRPPFFDNYRQAIEQLDTKVLTEADDLEIEANEDEITSLRQDYITELTQCQADFDTGFFPQYEDAFDLCEDIGNTENILERINLLEQRNEDIQHDDVFDMKERIREYDEEQLHAAYTEDGLGGYIYLPNWIATPGPKDMYDNLKAIDDNSGTTLTFTASTTRTQAVTFYEQTISETTTVANNFIAAVTNNSEYKRFEFTEETIDFQVNMTFVRWGRVTVRPDDWYTDAWHQQAQVAENTGHIKNGYTTSCTDDCDGDIPLTGEGGLVHDKISEMFVATHVEIYATGSRVLQTELEEFFEDVVSVRVGPFCTGDACHTTGNVILGGDDLTDHGSFSNGVNQHGWKYMELALASLMQNTFRFTYTPGTVAALGSQSPTNTYDAGAAILSAATANSLSVIFYDGATEIQRFFDELAVGTTNPQIIWIAGTGAANDLDSNEGSILTANAQAINDFTASGGGLLAHGSGDASYGWLFALLPNLDEVNGCDYSRAYLTPAGAEKFPTLTDNDIRAGPCHSHFTGDMGNLEVLGYDTSDKAFIIGGYGAIVLSSNEEEIEEVFLFEEEETIENVGLNMKFIFDAPQIIGYYAPNILPE